MDETNFFTRQKSLTVIALRGFRNVWSHSIAAGFHLTVVACGNASGHFIPPLFIPPGQRVARTLRGDCNVQGACVTCTHSGFINKAAFIRWAEMFADSIPTNVQRPLLLLFDGYLFHDFMELVALFVCQPANATHLVQHMDIAVFSSYKKQIRVLVHDFTHSSRKYWNVLMLGCF